MLNGTLDRKWIYQGQLEPVAEFDGSGNLLARYVYGTRAHVPDYVVKGDTTYRVISDHLGSVRLVVNASTGTIAQQVNYDAFGRISFTFGTGFQPFRYAGGLWDEETELVRFGVRDYDPQIGRWTSRDPIGFLGGSPNLYAYVDGDPINLIDPTGTTVQEQLDGIAGTADLLSCGLASRIRDKYFSYHGIDRGSAAYGQGVEDGRAIVEALAFGGAGKALGLVRAARGALNLPFRSPALRSQVDDVVRHFDEFGSPPQGVLQGGRRGGPQGLFENSQGRLPNRPRGYYTESDVWPGSPGNRGPERLIFGQGGDVYYTPNHYKNFVRIR